MPARLSILFPASTFLIHELLLWPVSFGGLQVGLNGCGNGYRASSWSSSKMRGPPFGLLSEQTLTHSPTDRPACNPFLSPLEWLLLVSALSIHLKIDGDKHRSSSPLLARAEPIRASSNGCAQVVVVVVDHGVKLSSILEAPWPQLSTPLNSGSSGSSGSGGCFCAR